jgi:glutamate formiminotransferase/formiminotetrahydrofolate cyclodeaminase
MQEGLKLAVTVPLATARRSYQAMEVAAVAVRHGNPNCITDALVGLTIAFAGVRGGVWNVLINLKSITDAAYVAEMLPACSKLVEDAEAILDRTTAEGDGRLRA